MQNYFFVTIVGLLLAMAAQANAQKTDFFWSAFDLNMGTKNGPVVLFPKSVGDSGSLFLYYTTGGPTGFDLDVGAFLDIATSGDGVIKFTDAQTYDFPIEFIGVEV